MLLCLFCCLEEKIIFLMRSFVEIYVYKTVFLKYCWQVLGKGLSFAFQQLCQFHVLCSLNCSLVA